MPDQCDVLTQRLDRAQAGDWDALLQWTRRQNLTYRLWRTIVQHRLQHLVPEAARQTLRQASLYSIAEDQRRQGDIRTILDALHQAHIDVIPLKGAYLAYAAYKDSWVRPMSDLDWLVRKEDTFTALDVMRGIGWSPPPTGPGFTDFMDTEDGTTPLFKDGHTAVEVHWALEAPKSGLAIDMEDVWHRSRLDRLLGQPCRTLSPEDFLLHVCIHAGYHHRFHVGLSTLYDVAACIRHRPPDWTVLDQRMRDWGVHQAVGTFLVLAQNLAEAPLPPEFGARLHRELAWAVEQAEWLMCEVYPFATDGWSIVKLLDDFRRGKAPWPVRLWRLLMPKPEVMEQAFRQPQQAGLSRVYLSRARDRIASAYAALARLVTSSRERRAVRAELDLCRLYESTPNLTDKL
ncbi:MAG: nucleotidyltransferase family protein [Deltaproteobacteria bacterium]|nr:nucleotidyltransferase family protein [Deltaproteobacteria bacterium]